MKPGHSWAWALAGILSAGCMADTGDDDDRRHRDEGTEADSERFSSAIATLLVFDFDGEVVATTYSNAVGKVRAQLLYTVGHLNAESGVSRLNAVKLTKVKTTAIGNGLYRFTYHASLPVAWGSKDDLPAEYTLTLPKRVDTAGQAAFMAEYGPSCTEHDGHELTSANVWYYYRPNTEGCALDPADVTVSVASVVPSPFNTDDKYPEYHRIWEDGVLDVVAVFGKEQKSGTTEADAGIAAYDQFIGAVRSMFPEADTTPMTIPEGPGIAAPDITFDIETDEGHVSIVAILVDEVKTASAAFDARFAEATPRADLILYGGHAGLGANVQALTKKARFFPAKYQLLFLNGCDTFAYEDDSLVAARKLLNPSDPTGTKYMDVMRNAMPAYFHKLSSAAMAVIDAMLDSDDPRTYQEIFAQIDPKQVVLVTGEEDNVYTPDFDPGDRWDGLEQGGAVGYKQAADTATDVLPAGQYIFETTPEPSFPGGDADLYLRVGSAPSATSTYKCPSYKYNSNERCLVTLSQPAKVFLKVVGDDSIVVSPYALRAWQRFP
jgi:hypothetical protein